MSQRTAGAAAPRHYLPTTLTPHRYQRTRMHLATTLQLYGRWCARPTAMWQDRLAMWPPVMMVNSSKLDEPSMQARKPGHRASLRRHRTHTVVRSHQYDTLRPYARRLRGRVFKRSPPYFSLFRCDPLSAKTICPSGNCSPMAFWCNDTMMSCVKHKLNPHALTAELRCHGAQVQVPCRQVRRV